MNYLYDLIASFITFFISFFIDNIADGLNSEYWMPYNFGSIIGNFITVLFSIKSVYKYMTISFFQHIFYIIIFSHFTDKIAIFKSIVYVLFYYSTDRIADKYIVVNNKIIKKKEEDYTLARKKKFKLVRGIFFVIMIELLTKYYINIIDITNILKIVIGYILFKKVIQ